MMGATSVLMRTVISLNLTPPLQGGGCTFYSVLWVSGECSEPGAFV